MVYLPTPNRFALAHEIGHIYLEGLDGYWKGRIMLALRFDPAAIPWDNGTGAACAMARARRPPTPTPRAR